MAERVELTVRCDECGKVAARFELLSPAAKRARGSERPARDLEKHWFYVWTFERYGDSEITLERFELLRQPLTDGDHGALYKIDWHLAIPWCSECDRCYCLDHWDIEYPSDDPFCSEWGTCPRGHGKILDN